MQGTVTLTAFLSVDAFDTPMTRGYRFALLPATSPGCSVNGVPLTLQRRSDVSTLAWPRERDACGVGFIADLQGRRERRVLEHALEALSNLAHRGAVSADGKTGDGAGILTQLPYRLIQRELHAAGIRDVADEEIGVGMFFVANNAEVERLYEVIEEVLDASTLRLLIWRDLPIDDDALGEIARARRPVFKQAIVAKPAGLDALDYERLLYLTRKRMETALMDADLGRAYISSFSSRTVVYKGLMVADQLDAFYRDLADPDYETSLAVFHPALLDETPCLAGRSPSRSGCSPTTARSTPCRAT